MRVQKRYKLVSRESHPENTVVNVDGVKIGGDQILPHGRPVLGRKRGAAAQHRRGGEGGRGDVLRGGAYKPRTSPYEFQGLGKEGLRLLALAAKKPD